VLVRKVFCFEGAHIVRGSVSKKCAMSIHGHSYRAEFLFKCLRLDEAGISADFTILKSALQQAVSLFDHTLLIWRGDKAEYIEAMKSHSDQYIILPVNPSAEQIARALLAFALIATSGVKELGNVEPFSVILHETKTGYAQAFLEDLGDPNMGGALNIKDFEFSPSLREDAANFFANAT
jgi:6-pyruvoyltetrahydropterin/6-carboxytetrahydropterin synthase